ncbi:MAG: glycosyltransferase family 39 protein [Candidatus Magnetomorum sp.]|nr:glycosyltransferase family 39 protein [Candidatus Magnetomorum sp.]
MLASIFQRMKTLEFPENNYRLAFLVILLGVVIRLFACEYTYIINSDGVLYVHQARALYYNNIDSLYNCGVSYLSIYPQLIAFLYPLTGDFLTAAITVSCFFGCLTLLPIYFLTRRFFSVQTSTLVTLIYALLPVFVARSADVLRGPVCWFFLAMGILTFIQYIDHRKWGFLLLSFVCFFCSTWARIEAIVSFPSMFLYLFIVANNKKSVFIKCCGIAAVIIVISIFLELVWGISVHHFYRIDEIGTKFSEPLNRYEYLRSLLKEISHKNRFGFLDNFIINARHQIHFVALGALINNACEAFFYPFIIFFIAGLFHIRKKVKEDPRLWFFLIMSVSSFCIVFVHIIHSWMIEYRYFALAIVSTSVFAAFGIESGKKFLSNYFKMKPGSAVVCICLFILVFGLGKNLKSREEDKYIYRLMGETIEKIEQSNQPVFVATLLVSSVSEKVHFYANRSYQGAICSRQRIDFQTLAGNSYTNLVDQLKRHNVHYFLWEKRWWPEEWFDFRTSYHKKDFIQMMRFQESGDDRIILYKLINTHG